MGDDPMALLGLEGALKHYYYYFIYETPNSTWLYAESFLSQATAQQFCRAAGGTLAVPVTPLERQEVFTLLNSSLTPGAWNQLSSDRTSAEFIFGVWIGLRLALPNTTWHTMAGDVATPPLPWAPKQPVKDSPCAVLRWKPDGMQAVASRENASYWPNDVIAWEASDCDTTLLGDALPALCKLPVTGVPEPDVPYRAGSFATTPYGGLKRVAPMRESFTATNCVAAEAVSSHVTHGARARCTLLFQGMWLVYMLKPLACLDAALCHGVAELHNYHHDAGLTLDNCH
jgi:hypothetical protein